MGVTEWQVVWFPSDRPDAKKTYQEESVARARFSAEHDAGNAPMLLKRVIPDPPEWEIVENSVKVG